MLEPRGLTRAEAANAVSYLPGDLVTFRHGHRAAYVAISRACSHATLYTDSRVALTEALGSRDGAQSGALDEALDQ